MEDGLESKAEASINQEQKEPKVGKKREPRKNLNLAKIAELARSLHDESPHSATSSPESYKRTLLDKHGNPKTHRPNPVLVDSGALRCDDMSKASQLPFNATHASPSAAELANNLESIRRSLRKLSSTSSSPSDLSRRHGLSPLGTGSTSGLSRDSKQPETPDNVFSSTNKDHQRGLSMESHLSRIQVHTARPYQRNRSMDLSFSSQVAAIPLPSPVVTNIPPKNLVPPKIGDIDLLEKYSERNTPSTNGQACEDDDFLKALDGKLSNSSRRTASSLGLSPATPTSVHISPKISLQGPALVTLEEAKASGLADVLKKSPNDMSFNPKSRQWEGGEPVDMSGFDSSPTCSEATSEVNFTCLIEENAENSDFSSGLEGDITAAVRRFFKPSPKIRTDRILAWANSSSPQTSNLKLIPPAILRAQSDSTTSDGDDGTFTDMLDGAVFNEETYRWEFPSEKDVDLAGFSSCSSCECSPKIPTGRMASFASSYLPSPPPTADLPDKKDMDDWRDSFTTDDWEHESCPKIKHMDDWRDSFATDDWANDLEGEVQTAGLVRRLLESSSSEVWTSEGGGSSTFESPSHAGRKNKIRGNPIRGPLLIRPEDVNLSELKHQLQQANSLDQEAALLAFEDNDSTEAFDGNDNASSDEEDWDADFEGDLNLQMPIPGGKKSSSPATKTSKPATPVVPRIPSAARPVRSQMHTFGPEDFQQAEFMIASNDVYWDPNKRRWISTQERERGDSSGFESNEDSISDRKDSSGNKAKSIGKGHSVKGHSLSPQPGFKNRMGNQRQEDLAFKLKSKRVRRGKAGSSSSIDGAESSPKGSDSPNTTGSPSQKRSSSAPVRKREKERASLQESDTIFNPTREHRQAFSRCQKAHQGSMLRFLGRSKFDQMEMEGMRRLMVRNPAIFHEVHPDFKGSNSEKDDESTIYDSDEETKCGRSVSPSPERRRGSLDSPPQTTHKQHPPVSSSPIGLSSRQSWRSMRDAMKGPIRAKLSGLGSSFSSQMSYHHFSSATRQKEKNRKDRQAADKRRVIRFIEIRDIVLEQLNHHKHHC